jgi:hypothetical protein
MLFDFLRSRRERDAFDGLGAPPSFIGNGSAPLDMTRFSTGELNSQLTSARRTDASWPFDPRA